jgi:predicted SAM-dependent methyltransferase
MAAHPISIVSEPLKLNLGCCDSHLKGFLNVDICEPADVIADLTQPWPWGDSTVEQIAAWDIFEHLPNKIHTMNETHRVLKAGGRLDLFVPTTDGRGAFQDPQHVSFWTPNDLTARFRVIQQQHTEAPGRVWHLRAILEAVK